MSTFSIETHYRKTTRDKDGCCETKAGRFAVTGTATLDQIQTLIKDRAPLGFEVSTDYALGIQVLDLLT